MAVAAVSVVTVAAAVLVVVNVVGACAAESGTTDSESATTALAARALVPAGLAAGGLGVGLAAGEAKSGKATFYGADGGGNCSFDASGPGLYVALGPSEYAAGAACGGYLDVTGPSGTVRVKVTDQCPECEAGHIDLSREAFARIGNVGSGVVPVTFRRVLDPKLAGALTVRVKEGASRYWLAVRIDNSGNPLSNVEVRAGGGWVALARTDYNYWIKADGAGSGPYQLRLTDTAGHQVQVTPISLVPDQVQRTTVWMYGGGAAVPVPSASPSSSTAPASATASASATPSGSGDSASTDPSGGRAAAAPAPSRSKQSGCRR